MFVLMLAVLSKSSDLISSFASSDLCENHNWDPVNTVKRLLQRLEASLKAFNFVKFVKSESSCSNTLCSDLGVPPCAHPNQCLWLLLMSSFCT